MHFPNSFQICPYLRNLKLTVVDNLDKVGQALQSNPQITLDKVTLAYGEDQPSVEQSLTTFLQVSSKYFMCVCVCVCVNVCLGSVAGPVIQVTGRKEFEDGLRPGSPWGVLSDNPSIRTSSLVTLVL